MYPTVSLLYYKENYKSVDKDVSVVSPLKKKKSTEINLKNEEMSPVFAAVLHRNLKLT